MIQEITLSQRTVAPRRAVRDQQNRNRGPSSVVPHCGTEGFLYACHCLVERSAAVDSAANSGSVSARFSARHAPDGLKMKCALVELSGV